jgi:predicted transcriptional regulator
MNLFSCQGKALPNKVREEIVQKYLDNYSVTLIAAGLNLPYKTVSNIIDVWLSKPTIEPKRGGNTF